MKPENILRSDILDILFENRNKDYGAYTLRRNYNIRLLQAMGVTILLAGVFFLLQGLPSHAAYTGQLAYNDTLRLIAVALPPKDLHKAIEQPRQKSDQPKQPQKTLQHNEPLIKPDDQVKQTTVHPVDELARHRTGIAADGPRGDPDIVEPPRDDHPVTSHTPPLEPVITAGPMEVADVMPRFDGDVVKFMLRHLRQPDDLEAGEKIQVRVKFVVTEEGNISDIQVIQSGRSDLDREVIRVIKMMPRWKPGQQAGRAVPVYFKMPVTFVSNSD